MSEHEINEYRILNELAEPGGIVIFGTKSDKKIPLCELKQSFSLQENLYNRSMSELSITNAIRLFDITVVSLKPSCILLHLGTNDVDLFTSDTSEFDQSYCKLIRHIKASVPKCNIGIVSLGNPDNSATITDMNKRLKYIAESERCEFEDISVKRVWNPKETKDIVSFVYSTGFVRPLKKNRSVYDLVQILFCYK